MFGDGTTDQGVFGIEQPGRERIVQAEAINRQMAEVGALAVEIDQGLPVSCPPQVAHTVAQWPGTERFLSSRQADVERSRGVDLVRLLQLGPCPRPGSAFRAEPGRWRQTRVFWSQTRDVIGRRRAHGACRHVDGLIDLGASRGNGADDANGTYRSS